ncbi:MAG: hemerythrin domain-containing protein [Pseudomonadota bacterium]
MATGSKTTSKTAGAVKGAAKALAGYPGIFHHLAGEHAEVSALMQRVAASSPDSNVRDELFPEIRRNLLAHAHGEEEEFYPRLREHTEIEPLVRQCLQEHEQVEHFLEQLDAEEKSTDTWQGRFREMMQAVESHVEREENELFPKAKELMSGQDAREMEERYESVEAREKQRLQ